MWMFQRPPMGDIIPGGVIGLKGEKGERGQPGPPGQAVDGSQWKGNKGRNVFRLLFTHNTPISYATIRYESLTWTEKLSVVSLI